MADRRHTTQGPSQTESDVKKGAEATTRIKKPMIIRLRPGFDIANSTRAKKGIMLRYSSQIFGAMVATPGFG